MKTLGRSLSEDEETTEEIDVDAESNAAADYSFDGFEVDFSEKIALTPAGAEGRR